MNQDRSGPAATQTPAPKPFKTRYKLQGMIVSVLVMWLDYVLIHQGLVGNDLNLVGAGMVIMLAGAASAFYFG